MNTDDLLKFADALGITRSYTALDNREIPTSIDVAQRFVEAMGHAATDEAFAELMKSRWAPGLEPVAVVRPGEPGRATWTVPHRETENTFEWTLLLEDGTQRTGQVPASECPVIEEGRYDDKRALPLPAVATGYHRLRIADRECLVICAPEQAYRPEQLDRSRVWGPTIQLYAVRSERNWGIGDFADLRALITHFAKVGADFVGLNPLHALFPDNPAHCSPYSPSSRIWLNPIYIAVDEVPEAGAIDVTADLDALRASDLVDYPAVYAAKLNALRAAYLRMDAERQRAFEGWVAEKGESLELFTRWEALQLAFAAEGRIGFPHWPEAYQTPDAPLPAELREEQRFRQYLQWLAAEQLASASRAAEKAGMSIGLYTDLAVGVEGASAERWARRPLYGAGASVGAPPDDFNLKGQDWGMPPPIPDAMRADGHRAFREVLVSAMGTSGAIRVDHVMALRRLYWVPAGMDASEGAYVLYPFDELMAVLTLESSRRRCLVIGEDLGVVPPEVTQVLRASRSFSYRLMFFETDDRGTYKTPAEMLRESLTVGSTHDLPTLRGFWEGRDIKVRDELDLWPNAEARAKFVAERENQRQGLLDALARENLVPSGLELPDRLPQSMADALMVYVARGANELMAIQLEDVLGQLDQVNLPGTVDEHPNWKRKLPSTIEALFADSSRVDLFRRLSEARGRPVA
ncbi:MAG: 4-alpha-glucanotransferase [Myxococcota bacterium]